MMVHQAPGLPSYETHSEDGVFRLGLLRHEWHTIADHDVVLAELGRVIENKFLYMQQTERNMLMLHECIINTLRSFVLERRHDNTWYVVGTLCGSPTTLPTSVQIPCLLSRKPPTMPEMKKTDISDYGMAEKMPTEALDFSQALRLLKLGRRIARAGWNGKNMWLCYMPGMVVPEGLINHRTKAFVPEGPLNVGGYIVMWTADGTWQPGWLASQNDLLANDWVLLP